MEKFPTVMQVAALALVRSGGQVLMHRRRQSAMHGGLWEFPGGKLEPGESHAVAVVREILEELGIEVPLASLTAVGDATRSDDLKPVMIRLFLTESWSGEPQCLEGEEIAWFAPGDLAGLAMPPLDYPLAEQLLLHMAKEAK